MQLTQACIVGLLMVVGLVTSPRAHGQTASSVVPIDDYLPRAPEARPVHKTSWLFKSTELSLAGATAFDMTTTAQGLAHPTAAYTPQGKFLMDWYVAETGWAKCFGNRDTPAIIAGNVLMNVGVDRASRRLYTRGGRWRIVAFGLIVGKTAINGMDAIHNNQYMRTIDQRVRMDTGYRGAIVWRH